MEAMTGEFPGSAWKKSEDGYIYPYNVLAEKGVCHCDWYLEPHGKMYCFFSKYH
jgi:hypothetical protein